MRKMKKYNINTKQRIARKKDFLKSRINMNKKNESFSINSKYGRI